MELSSALNLRSNLDTLVTTFFSQRKQWCYQFPKVKTNKVKMSILQRLLLNSQSSDDKKKIHIFFLTKNCSLCSIFASRRSINVFTGKFLDRPALYSFYILYFIYIYIQQFGSKEGILTQSMFLFECCIVWYSCIDLILSLRACSPQVNR